MNIVLPQKLKDYLNKINLEKLEKIFFAFFLLSIPLQTRLTFYTSETYSNGVFNEYATFFLYLSDILFITTLFLLFVNKTTGFTSIDIKNRIFLYLDRHDHNKQLTKSFKAVNALTFNNFFSIIKQLVHAYPRFIPIFTLLVTLITWSFINILWSEHKNIAFYQSVKILEFSLLLLYIRHRLQWFGITKFIPLIFISGFVESLIGIAQYCLQKSLGLKILMESVLSPEIPNVAKIVIDGERIIRAYGTFPHPNVFSGFLILSIFCGFWLLFSLKTLNLTKIVSRVPAEANTPNKMVNLINKKQIVSRETILQVAKEGETFSTKAKMNKRLPAEANILNKVFNLSNKSQIVSRETILYAILTTGILIQLTAFVLTFSRTAWLTIILILLIFAFLVIKPKLFHVKQFQARQDKIKQFSGFIFKKTNIILIFSIIIPLLLIISINWKQIVNRTSNVTENYQQSIDNRVLYNNIAVQMIKNHPIAGVGGKNFTVKMQKFTNNSLEPWQFQPAHNIYLLIASELGVPGLTLFLFLLYLIIKTSIISNKSQNVSRLPAEANTLNRMLNSSNKNQIVSRETILPAANENETFSAKAAEGETNYAKKQACEVINSATNKDNMELSLKTRNETFLLQIGLISILFGFLFIGLFDHYFWTLQQGQLTFWIVLGVLSALTNKSY